MSSEQSEQTPSTKRPIWKLNSSRISQLTFLAVFLVLFVTTDYRGQDEISVAVNSFFRADPLVVVDLRTVHRYLRVDPSAGPSHACLFGYPREVLLRLDLSVGYHP